MSTVADILGAAAELRRIQSRNLSLTDGKTRLDAVSLRSDVVSQFGDINKHIESASGQLDPDMSQALRNAFSAMRAATAYHHSKWPVVSVDQGEQSYHDSLNGVLKSNKAFFDIIDRLTTALPKLELRRSDRE
jgi:hypothetical protein